jgi:prepilin-type N-terminal cleavage/methylation domain-containing protein
MSTRAHTQQAGFTILEVMIAMAIFIVLVTIGIGSVLEAMSAHERTKNVRTVMDNLNFIMEDMARNVRLGSEIRCVTSSPDSPYTSSGDVIPQSCPNGSNQIVFRSLTGAHLMYTVSLPNTPVPNQILKSVNDEPAQFVTPAEVVVDPARSGFTVTGAPTISDNDFAQPTVTIRLAGTITYKGVPSDFAIQTTVTVRQLDS